MSLSGRQQEIQDLVKGKKALLVYFSAEKVRLVRNRVCMDLGYIHTELIKKRMYNCINMLLFLWLFIEFYLSVQQRTVHRFHGKSLHDINPSRKQMVI